MGRAPTAEQKRFLDAQIEIIHETIAMIRPGVRIGDVATRAIEMAKEFGYEEWFYFRGHGIGATTHIPPTRHHCAAFASAPGRKSPRDHGTA